MCNAGCFFIGPAIERAVASLSVGCIIRPRRQGTCNTVRPYRSLDFVVVQYLNERSILLYEVLCSTLYSVSNLQGLHRPPPASLRAKSRLSTLLPYCNRGIWDVNFWNLSVMRPSSESLTGRPVAIRGRKLARYRESGSEIREVPRTSKRRVRFPPIGYMGSKHLSCTLSSGLRYSPVRTFC